MLKRIGIVLALSLILIIAAQPIQRVNGVLMTPTEVEALNTTPAPEPIGSKRGGNTFVRVLTAPFRAIGRIFGAGKNDGKLHRLSEKDVKKFETAPTVKVVDATLVSTPEAQGLKTNPAPATNEPPATKEEANRIEARQNVARAQVLIDSNNLNAAFDLLTAAIKLDPNNGNAHNLLGIAYESKGMHGWALKSFETAVRCDRDQPEFLNNLGYLHFKTGEYDSAAKYLKRAVKAAPNQQRYWNNLGLAEVQRRNFDEAFIAFEHAVGEFDGHMNLANRLQALGYENQAIKHLELARALQPNSKEILVRLIALYKRAGKVELAEQARANFVTLTTVATAPNQ